MPFKQIARVTTGLLNTVNDALPGAPVSSGTGQSSYSGQLGALCWFGPSTGGGGFDVKYDSSVGTLYEGWYQYVKVLPTANLSPVLGQIAFWNDLDDFVVTPDVTDGQHAGVFINSITKGNYGWIQVSGLATVKYRATITKATPAIKDVVVVQSGQPVADVELDTTPYTNLIYKRILGIAFEAPVGGALKLVELLARLNTSLFS